MNVRISRAALERIVSQASATPDEECCGLLLGASHGPESRVDSLLPAANVAADRTRFFEIDPAVLIRAHRVQRDGGPRILGCYHSHPGGDATPSAQDAAQAAPDGSLWLICAGPPWAATLWRAVEAGAVHGRFDSVPLIVESPDNTDP